MSILSHSPFLKALGWCLLNSIWQFAVIWLLFIAIVHIRRSLSPAIKHGFALVFLSIGFIWFAVALSIRYFTFSELVEAGISVYSLPDNTRVAIAYQFLQSFLENNLSYFSIIYLLVVAGFFVRFFGFFYYAQTLQTRGLNKMRAEWRLYVQQLSQQLNIRHKVHVWISENIDTPMVMGFLKPTILIPVACINQLSVKQLEAILLHELAHIKRNDYLVNLYIATTEILFFFNPFARLLIRSIKQEREKSCDDWVIQFRFDPYLYASALFELEQHRSTAYSLGLAANGESKSLLLQRIQRILGVQKTHTSSGFKLLAYFLTIALLGFIALVNPGEVVLKNIENRFSAISSQIPTYAVSYDRITTDNTSKPVLNERTQQRERKRRQWANAAPVVVEQNSDEEENVFDVPVSVDLKDDEQPAITLLNSITLEKKDFSIKEKDPKPAPEAATNNEFPFVPNSSYSYFSTEDSSLAELKVEKYNNQVVRESLARAQREIQRLDLNKIEKIQKNAKSNLIVLRNKINETLQQQNVQQMYKLFVDSSSYNNLVDYGKAFLKTETELTNYNKVLQLQYESIKTQIRNQEERNKRGMDSELKAIQNQIRKIKVIVNI